jgi:(E)-4-hydroxy-3-methylbut-2-enyl-diphosphate synthase
MKLIADDVASLPGTGEAPRCPIYIDGKKDVTLEGNYDELATAFQALVDNYIAKKYPRKAAETVPAGH